MPQPRPSCLPVSAAEMSRRLGRGINFGNALDTGCEGESCFRLDEHYFDCVKEAGFDTIRLPVRWSAHAAGTAPYRIDEKFIERVDSAIEMILGRDMNAVLNIHHYRELMDAAEMQAPRFLALWSHIASRHANRSDRLFFELLNEPHEPMTAECWNDLLADALAVVRESNPARSVIVGPWQSNEIGALPRLRLPLDDHLIVTIHYYDPYRFTHQGAGWLADTDRWVGTTWGDDADREVARRDLSLAATWALENKRPLFLGEFGAYSKADLESRRKWTTFVRSEAERLGMSWAYSDFGTDFGAFDTEMDAWREPLKQALLGL